jgi:hypothetical protein
MEADNANCKDSPHDFVIDKKSVHRARRQVGRIKKLLSGFLEPIVCTSSKYYFFLISSEVVSSPRTQQGFFHFFFDVSSS